MASLWTTLSKMTVTEGTALLQKTVTTTLNPATLPARYTTWYKNYKTQYVDTNSLQPLIHVSIGVFCISYLTSWRAEYRHMKHAQDHGH
ncbi:hypothetical protein NFJ02_39g97430 [Pycnococcus provasolii]